MPHLPVPLPKLHCGQAANVLTIRKGRVVAFGLELANPHDVPADAIEIMQTVMSHRQIVSEGLSFRFSESRHEGCIWRHPRRRFAAVRMVERGQRGLMPARFNSARLRFGVELHQALVTLK